MDGQRARLVTPALDRVPAIRKVAPTPAPRAPRLLTTTWAAALGIGWPLAIVASVALEPAPAEPEAAVPLFVELGMLGLFAALVTTAVAAGLRHPGAAGAGVVTGLIAFGFTIACPVSGHHELGGWWYGQLALTGAMLVVSLAALGRRDRMGTAIQH
jgi:hypothetical protein